MKTVPLSGKRGAGLVARVDDDKFPLVLPYTWWLLKPQRSLTGYAVSQVRTDRCGECGQRKIQNIRMHNLITGWDYVDHEDGDGLNNQGYNLREANQALNEAAKHKTTLLTSSRFKGVTWNKNRSKWQAGLQSDGKFKFLGRYADEEDAARAYDKGAVTEWGEFARLNFPEG
jgi:hypothetical protein